MAEVAHVHNATLYVGCVHHAWGGDFCDLALRPAQSQSNGRAATSSFAPSLFFNSVRDELANLLAVNATAQIDDLFGRLALDERLLAGGFCDREGLLRYHSKLTLSNFSCEIAARATSASFSAIGSDDRRLLVGSFPIATDETSRHLVLLHDLTFAEQRSAPARTWIAIALTGVALIGAAVASIFALVIVRRWLQSSVRFQC